MSPETLSSFKSISLEGYELTPNESAGFLEKHLGITFPQIPDLVIMDSKNRSIWARSLPNLFARLISKSEGGYDFHYHAIFVNDDFFAQLHENMHGYNAATNPIFGEQQEQLGNKIEAVVNGKPHEDVNFEEVLAVRSFDEGMAQWAAVETASQMPEEFDSGEVGKMRNLMLSGKEELSKIKKGIEYYQKAVASTNKFSILAFATRAEMVSKDSQYKVGYRFVSGSVDTLRNKGLPLGQAINFLVMNPPQTLAELADITVFFKGV
jgi:hypothetical protein